MVLVDLIIPKMGESVTEATIQEWLKAVGDRIEMDEDVLSTATDKVEATVPSHVEGVLKEILFPEGETVPVGTVVARIEVEGEGETTLEAAPTPTVEATPANHTASTAKVEKIEVVEAIISSNSDFKNANRFYSPLVRSIAKQENVGLNELEAMKGSGLNGRVTKKDMLSYLENRTKQPTVTTTSQPTATKSTALQTTNPAAKEYIPKPGEEIIPMGRVRQLIANHMVHSLHTSPHVTSFVEADVTNMFKWRSKVKNEFATRHNQRLTFTPLFMEAVVKAIRDFPLVNVSVHEDKIILKKYINLGMAAAQPSGNLIVPVVKNADQLNLVGLASAVNDLANRARTNKLTADEISGGTFTLTNVGTFGNLSGTPIINQPQVAILSTGAIIKKPAVLETEHGDVIAIRHMMMLSLSYDHRVVDGFLGGSFLRRIADYMEDFDSNREI